MDFACPECPEGVHAKQKQEYRSFFSLIDR